MNTPLTPPIPFVWPEPLVSAGVTQYASALPFEAVARAALSVFGVVSAIDAQAVDWMEGYLSDNPKAQLRLVISIHPTCRTTEADLQNLLRLVERHGQRADYRVFPEASLLDRSSNLLCLCGTDGQTAISVGPTENMGFAQASPSQANLVTTVTAATFEACRKWFDYLWAIAGPLRPELVAAMPHLVLPQGDLVAAQLWDDYRQQCLSQDAQDTVEAVINPETGEPVADGEMGELVFTSLTKEALPIIRYRTRDLTRLLPGTARSMRRMEKITGRSDDMMIIRGVNVFPSQIEELILKRSELAPHYQCVLTRDGPMDDLKVLIETRPGVSPDSIEARAAAKMLQHEIKVYIGSSVAIELKAEGGVERSQGKAKRVVDLRGK